MQLCGLIKHFDWTISLLMHNIAVYTNHSAVLCIYITICMFLVSFYAQKENHFNLCLSCVCVCVGWYVKLTTIAKKST